MLGWLEAPLSWACLGTGPAREHNLGIQMWRRLGPGLALTQRLGAAPPPLAPHQPSGPTEAGQITDRGRSPLVRCGLRAAAGASLDRGDRLDLDDELGRCLIHLEDPETG